jgi:uncharacterized protein YjbI with pentapeptide repeats
MTASKPPTFEDSPQFSDRVFEDLTLDAADLSNKEFEACTFRRCKFPQSRWADTRLEDCVFEGCDLQRILPNRLALRGVVFKDTRLMGVDWTGVSTLPNVHFEKCDLRYSSYVKLILRKTRFVNCMAREANFIETDLTDSDFSGTDLQNSTIQGCVLVKTNFATATGVMVDPRQNKVKGMRVGVDAAVALAQSFGIAVAGY